MRNHCVVFSLLLGLLIAGCHSRKKHHPVGNNPYYSQTDTTALQLPDSVWEGVLPDSIYAVARDKDTEEAFSGRYWKWTAPGTYACAACGHSLFRSEAKFASKSGWPSFYDTMHARSVACQTDYSHDMKRIEVMCRRCGAHLGHLFNDGPEPTYRRYCINSVVLNFIPDSLRVP